MTMTNKDYLTPEDVAALYRISEDELKKMRVQEVGPSYVKVGTRVLYKATIIDHWLYNKQNLTNEFTEHDLLRHYESTITNPEIPF